MSNKEKIKERNRIYRKKNPNKIREAKRKYYDANAEKERQASKKRQLIKKEKIAGRERPNQCDICGSIGKMVFDHNHRTGKFRGWICRRCNLVLGLTKDSPEILRLLIRYLKDKK